MVWRVYHLYHKAHSAGWGNVWCTHCDWREQPPLLIPLVLLHDISGKDIPVLVKPSLVLPLFSAHPSLLTLSSHHPSFLFFPISSSYLSFPLLVSLFHSTALHLALQTWPYLGLWEGVGVEGGRAEIIAMAIHIKTVQ